MYLIFLIINVEGLILFIFYIKYFSFLLFCIRNLKPKEIVYAMRTLGVNITVEQCVTYIEKESRDTL